MYTYHVEYTYTDIVEYTCTFHVSYSDILDVQDTFITRGDEHVYYTCIRKRVNYV